VEFQERVTLCRLFLASALWPDETMPAGQVGSVGEAVVARSVRDAGAVADAIFSVDEFACPTERVPPSKMISTNAHPKCRFTVGLSINFLAGVFIMRTL